MPGGSQILARVRVGVAAAVVAAACTAGAALFVRWHDVGTPDPERAAGAFYFGPDYNVTPEDRARMLEPAVWTPCTGIEHLGLDAWPLVLLAAAALIAVAAARAERPVWLFVAAAFAFAVAVGNAYANLLGGLLAHFLLQVSRSTAAPSVHEWATFTLEAALLATSAASIWAAIRARRARRLASQRAPEPAG